MSNFADLEARSDYFAERGQVDRDGDRFDALSNVMTRDEIAALDARSVAMGVSLDPPF